ncbi:iron ABC transporter permease [Helicobacter jaachi]|uniref:Iron ABC transporter permease n=1 Tax=Helicobacter jaachi TaxID=1677920 RepID=A0A4U8TC69_9HELI|nr:iron ABC transporter permease [Helicobacter jaachi]TLD97264.1 iron ABC transporter permease [Helicobacter jaachi]
MKQKNRYIIFILFVLGAYVIAVAVAMALGDEVWSIGRLFAVLCGGGEEVDRQILYDLRLPRIAMAILIGMLLASSGAVTQSIFANPIADPYIIGIASAASFGAVVAYILGLADFYFGIFGFVFCVVFSLVIFKLQKYANITTLLIIGIAISSFLGALTSLCIYYIGENSFKIVAWLMGYLGLASWDKVGLLLVPLVVCMGYFYAKRYEMNIILSGDEEARNLGVNAKVLKRNLLIASSLGVSFAVAFSGLIGFVGLVIPHIVRLLVKDYNNAIVLPLCTALGGVFLLCCDTLARSLLNVELPIGIITAFFGAPVFLYLALQTRRVSVGV